MVLTSLFFGSKCDEFGGFLPRKSFVKVHSPFALITKWQIFGPKEDPAPTDILFWVIREEDIIIVMIIFQFCEVGGLVIIQKRA